MNYQQAKEAFNTNTPIVYKNIEYERIEAITFRKSNGLEISQLELKDKSSNSVTVVRMKDCEVLDVKRASDSL